MAAREQYAPGPACGAQIRKDRGQNGQEKWTLGAVLISTSTAATESLATEMGVQNDAPR
jgi:hypothetical protein